MKTKVIGYGPLYCCLLFFSGCSLRNISSQQTIELQEPEAQLIKPQIEDKREITDKDMKIFFQQYLTIDEETMLILNQKPKQVTKDYWEAYGAYKTKTKDILGDYLSKEMKSKLNKQYLHDDFHYPRLLEINEYMVTGIHNVEDATIISKQIQENKDMYHVMITATSKVVDVGWANQGYRWDEEKGYYVKALGLDLDTKPQEDMIKITLNYWVELAKDEAFLVNAVREKSTINLGIHGQASWKNNCFISRIPYSEEVKEKDEEKIRKFLDSFMKQEYNYYLYYRKAHSTNYDVLKMALQSDLGLSKEITLKKENYESYFNPSIIPLKDDMDFLTFDVDQGVTMTPHISSSKRHDVYEVTLLADATLINKKVISYEYIYLFSFENDMIYSVRLMKQREIKVRGEMEKHA